MPAKNANIGKWSQSGVFNGPSSFLDFESRVNQLAEEKDRGDVFEIFIEGYLATQSIAQSRQHWVVGAIPLELRKRYKLPSDGTGIDGVYEAHDGSHVAYQVKYRQKANLTYREVAPFLGLTEQFSDRVIFTNASTLAHQALPRTRWVSRQDFAALSPEALTEICGWITEKPAPHPRATPDPRYQTQVLEDIAQALETNSRATVVMACGTGKTLVALWAVEQAKPKSVLVLLPSLSLVQQTVREWTRHTNLGSRFRFICVCSDDTVAGKRDSDALELDTTDLGFRVDTDPNTVKRFLSASDNAVRVVFSTYQSSDVVSAGTKGLNPFDIAVFDEAHKTTGLAGGQFSRPLSDAHIRIKKRLFFTATPRHIDIRSKRDKDGEYKVQSMDDPEVYGPRAHTLSFKAAADKGVICPYKVVISVVDKNLVDDFARKNGITLIDGDEVGVRWVSNLVALQQAIEQTAATKAITFHSRVNIAQDFASDGPRGIGRYLEGFEIRHVNGKQRSSDRADLIQAFATAPKSVITNARCLTEGVDIPAVDMVAFIDPRQSRVDIAQAVGRAMRKPRGETKKTVGYVFVPLFLGSEGESIHDAIKGERFDAVADVLNALQEHDEELVDLIREARQARGEGKPFKPRVLGDKVLMIGPRVELSRVVESVETKLVDSLGSSWDEWFGRLKRYKHEFGNLRVHQHFKSCDGYALGSWVSIQRGNRACGALAQDREKLLDELGFVWNVHDHDWQEWYQRLIDCKSEYGNANVSQNFYTRDGFKLGAWVSNQRSLKASGMLPRDREVLLESAGIVWNLRDTDWLQFLSDLDEFKEEYGHLDVPGNHVVEGRAVGARVMNIRGLQRKVRESKKLVRGALSGDRFNDLDKREFIWDLEDYRWYICLKAFKKYREENNVRLIPRGLVLDGWNISKWVIRQRSYKRQRHPALSDEKIELLNSIGFEWEPFLSQFEIGFQKLIDFKTRESSCDVPQVHSEGDFKLGVWCNNIRKQRKTGKLDANRIRELDAVGFSWAPENSQWERNFLLLAAYSSENGHARIPKHYVTACEVRLGLWLSNQKSPKSRARMPLSRRERLAAIGVEFPDD